MRLRILERIVQKWVKFFWKFAGRCDTISDGLIELPYISRFWGKQVRCLHGPAAVWKAPLSKPECPAAVLSPVHCFTRYEGEPFDVSGFCSGRMEKASRFLPGRFLDPLSSHIFNWKGSFTMDLQQLLAMIHPADKAAAQRASDYIDSLVKPLRSLGKLESIAVQLASITGQTKNTFPKRCVLIFSSDNGVVEEGVASAPQSVTTSQTINFTRGVTGVCVLAEQAGAEIRVYDMGVNGDVNIPGIISRKIRKGTSNIAKGPAMTRSEAVQALLTGAQAAFDSVDEGFSLLGIGEMGIGNTTTSSAVLCGLTGLDPAETSGKGAGLTEEAYQHKLSVIRTALSVNHPDSADPVDVLAKVGGFDLAAMTGAYLGAAARRVPVVIDGFISVVAALCAARICPAAADFMLPSHCSKEKGYAVAARELGVAPYLLLDMGLGEGSGCPIAFSVIDFACAMAGRMATFEEAAIDDGFLDSLQGADF